MKWFIVFYDGAGSRRINRILSNNRTEFNAEECVKYVATQPHVLKDHIKMDHLKSVKQVFCANEKILTSNVRNK